METIVIDGHSLTLDVRDELEQYDWGYGARWTEEKLIASSPFRDDNSPSFYINFNGKYAGRWGDSGALDPTTAFGNLADVLAVKMGVGYDEALEYLTDNYKVSEERDSDKDLKIPSIRLKEGRKKSSINTDRLLEVSNEYLSNRGISDEVQAEYRTGNMRNTPEFVALSWTDDVTGYVASIKNRAVEGRDMYYEKGSLGITNLVYGLYNAKNEKSIAICEGEIDVLSFAEAGIPAVALGTANISDRQVEKILYHGFERIYMAGDNDKAGLNLNRKLYLKFKGRSELYLTDYGEYEDANDALIGSGTQYLKEVINKAKEIKPILLTK